MKSIVNYTIIILVCLLLCILPWGFSRDYVQPQLGQFFLFHSFSLFVLILHSFKQFTFNSPSKNKITIIDLLLFLLLLIFLFQSLFLQSKDFSLEYLLETIGYLVLYITIRGIDKKYNIFILSALLVGAFAQAVYGNLQLYGIYPSNHGLFKMTGSFFNPGPYAGYLATILPISIAIFLLKYTASMLGKNKNITGVKPPALNLSHLKKEPTYNLGPFFKRFFNQINKFSNQLPAKGLHILIVATIIVILLVLPALKSRAAWLATIAALIYVLLQMRKGDLIKDTFPILSKWKSEIERWQSNVLLKVISITVIILIILGSTFALYQMKKGSANGRLLIWKVSYTMVKDKPLFGFGANGFEKNYMEYQAAFFNENPLSEEIYVADNNKYAFNEFVRTATETGTVGLAIGIFLLCFALFGKNGELTKSEKTLLISIRAAILSAIVFGMFSYPDDIIPIKVTFVLLLALSANYAKGLQFSSINNQFLSKIHKHPRSKLLKISIRTLTASALIMLSLFIVTNGSKLYTAAKTWKQAYTTYQMGAYSASINDYKAAYTIFKHNGDFLLNYGKALSMAEKHEEAIRILKQAKEKYPNTILYTALGDSFKALERNYEAEQAYIHAWDMIPSRFYPKYLLAKLYNKTRQSEKAVEVANELLTKEIKVQSTAIDEIKEEMRQILAGVTE